MSQIPDIEKLLKKIGRNRRKVASKVRKLSIDEIRAYVERRESTDFRARENDARRQVTSESGLPSLISLLQKRWTREWSLVTLATACVLLFSYIWIHNSAPQRAQLAAVTSELRLSMTDEDSSGSTRSAGVTYGVDVNLTNKVIKITRSSPVFGALDSYTGTILSTNSQGVATDQSHLRYFVNAFSTNSRGETKNLVGELSCELNRNNNRGADGFTISNAQMKAIIYGGATPESISAGTFPSARESQTK